MVERKILILETGVRFPVGVLHRKAKMAAKVCFNCGKGSTKLVGHLYKSENLSADIKMVCPACKTKLSKKKG